MQAALSSAKVAVLLVSADFLAEDSTWKRELPYCIEAAQNNELELVWIPVRTSDYQYTDLTHFEAAQDVEHPLASLEEEGEQDKVLLSIVERIKKALLEQ